MANVPNMCTSFKMELLNGTHAFGAHVAGRTAAAKDTFNMALFLVTASRGAADTVYNTTGEVATGGGYTQGGIAVGNTVAPTTSGTTAFWTPSAQVQWPTVTISTPFDCAVLYNATPSTKFQVAVFTFGSQTVTAGNFTLTMPANDSGNALIRIA